ncbi:uncharacterized protein TNCV_4601081 [Trichonephila clavipes]|nr:uncharacterized protein TNCV_4601081 [Trichonephila clavipes]
MCNSGLDMQVLKGKSGLAITFVLKCFACPYRVEFSSSNFHEGTQIATINTRFVYAMCSIGKGAESGKMFCGVMNLPQPPTRISPYGKRILNAAKLVYEDSIQNAAKEVICENEGNKNIAVAVDGTWQKRGYTSLNGVVTVTSIDTGNVIDVDILSKYCACKNLPFHEKDCKRNYVGSSGAMETQSYYGSAIRRNHSSVQNMRQAIWAIFLHNLSTDEYPQHGFCPIGEDSWCGFKRLKHQVIVMSFDPVKIVVAPELKQFEFNGIEITGFTCKIIKKENRGETVSINMNFSIMMNCPTDRETDGRELCLKDRVKILNFKEICFKGRAPKKNTHGETNIAIDFGSVSIHFPRFTRRV